MALPDIEIGSRFDAKGFKQAETAATKLEKNVKSLAKSFVGVFAAQKVLAFGKASVKAFAEDDAAAKSLGQTLKNLGLAYGANVGSVNGFINRLEMQTGILDDELRPALDRILRATGDVAESQKLLALALDIAAGTGKSVTQVSQSLQKAYLGQTQALGRLGVGLSKAELASSDFEQIQSRLSDLFAGQAKRASDSYQGSLNKLQVAANNAKETIGKGLVDALGTLSNSQNVDGTVSAIDRIAKSISNATVDFAKFIKVSKELLGTGFFLDEAEKAALRATKMGTRFTTPMSISSQDTQRADKAAADAAKKAAAAKLKAEKAAAAAKIAADKKAAANKAKLDKASSVFELQKIQIAAALKGKISEEEKTRLLLMQAIADEDATKAEALQKKLEEIQKQNAKIAADLLAIGQAKDPFATWAGSLALAVAQLSKLNSGITMIPGVTYNPAQSKDRNYDDALAAAAAAKAAADKAAADKAAAEAAAILGGASEKAAAEKAAADAAAAKLAKDAADKAAAAALGGAGITFNEEQNPDRNYDTKAAADAAAAAAVAVTNGSPVAGVNFNPSQSRDRNYDSGFGTQTPITVNVTNTGSVIMQDEFVKVINDAVTVGLGTGLKIRPPGSLPEFE
jgi:hypothetical protein